MRRDLLSALLVSVAVAVAAAVGCSSSPAARDGGGSAGPDAGDTAGGAAADGAAGTAGGDAATETGGTSDAGRPEGGAPDLPAADAGGMTPSGRGPAGGACPAGQSFGSPLPAEPTAVLIRGGFTDAILEAPVWVPAQRALFFSEINAGVAGRIHKYTPAGGALVVFADNVGVGGLALDPQGMMVAASHDGQRLTRFNPATGQRTDVAGGAMYNGRPFNQVNDAVVRSDGNIYFSDPAFRLLGRPGQDVMAFYRLSPAGIVTRIAEAVNANGVALSPDGARLYLSTTGGPPLQRFNLSDDGAVLGPAAPVIEGSSDGLAVDCAGNLYLSDGGEVKVVSPAGQPLGSVLGLGAGFVTNSAFGADDRRTLYITTRDALYQIRLNVPGFPN
jgi:gluconolactonase